MSKIAEETRQFLIDNNVKEIDLLKDDETLKTLFNRMNNLRAKINKEKMEAMKTIDDAYAEKMEDVEREYFSVLKIVAS